MVFSATNISSISSMSSSLFHRDCLPLPPLLYLYIHCSYLPSSSLSPHSLSLSLSLSPIFFFCFPSSSFLSVNGLSLPSGSHLYPLFLTSVPFSFHSLLFASLVSVIFFLSSLPFPLPALSLPLHSSSLPSISLSLISPLPCPSALLPSYSFFFPADSSLQKLPFP